MVCFSSRSQFVVNDTCKRGALGFSVLRFWLFFRSVFRFWWSLPFADFSFFSVWFSVFLKNTSGFSVLVPDVVFGFSYFVLFWVPVSVRFEQHLISNSRETPKLFRGMRDKINVMVGYHSKKVNMSKLEYARSRGTQREYSSKPHKHSIVEHTLVFKLSA